MRVQDRVKRRSEDTDGIDSPARASALSCTNAEIGCVTASSTLTDLVVYLSTVLCILDMPYLCPIIPRSDASQPYH